MRYADSLLEGAGAEAAGADSTASQALAAHKAGPPRRGANEARLDSLRTAPVLARRDAAAAGSFPLIVYPASFNADPSENALLLEYLASQGHVIASAPCLGRDGPAVARGVSGATAQREDLEFVLGDACRHPFADARGVGLLGFSWGGSPALLLALRHAGVDAVASLDGAFGFAECRHLVEDDLCGHPSNLRASLLKIVPRDEDRDTRTTDPEVRLFDEQHLLRYAVA